jgi:tRNA-modifying protein YgfZ
MKGESTVDSRQSTAAEPQAAPGPELAHRFRPAAIVDVEGPDRVSFLQGQLTQDVKAMRPGETRAAAGLTPKGKLLFIARLHALPDRMRLLLSPASRESVLAHLRKYALFQKVTVSDASDAFLRVGLYGEAPAENLPEGATRLPGEGELAAEILLPVAGREEINAWLRARSSHLLSDEEAEVRRVEAGRPRFGQDANESNLPDEVGLDEAISTTKGCYVGQEIVARMRTYGRANRRLVGFRFPQGGIPAASLLRLPEESEPGKIEQGRVTSSVLSPRFGAIGLGYAFREVPVEGRLIWASDPSRCAIVAELPFA